MELQTSKKFRCDILFGAKVLAEFLSAMIFLLILFTKLFLVDFRSYWSHPLFVYTVFIVVINGNCQALKHCPVKRPKFAQNIAFLWDHQWFLNSFHGWWWDLLMLSKGQCTRPDFVQVFQLKGRGFLPERYIKEKFRSPWKNTYPWC